MDNNNTATTTTTTTRSPSESNSVSSPSTEEASAYPDFVSSYTQISLTLEQQLQQQQSDQQTDIESSDDEFEDDDQYDQNDGNDGSGRVLQKELPQLSSQIIEWSKERAERYTENSMDEDDDEDDDNKSGDQQRLPIGSTAKAEEPAETTTLLSTSKQQSQQHQLCHVQMKLLQNLETHANQLSKNVNNVMQFICNSSRNITSTSLETIKVFDATLGDASESVDANIKLMYKIIANCEELNRSLSFVETLANKVREVKQTLDMFEKLIEKN